MIPTPDGWSIHRGAEELLLTHPRGAAYGALRYQERVAPCVPISAMIERALRELPDFVRRRDDVCEPAVTDEGEYAVIVTIDGVSDGRDARLHLGFVLAEDFYSRTMCLTADDSGFDASAEMVGELVRREALVLGVRRRRFLYTPPPGWYGVPWGLQADWYAPDAPSQRAVVSIWPATPVAITPLDDALTGLRAQFEAEGFSWDEAAGVTRATSSYGLRGVRVRFRHRGGDRVRDLVALADDRYVYVMRLEVVRGASADRHWRAFAQVVDSAQPLPNPRGVGRHECLEHWVC